jgi:hypothetical protein
MKNTKKSSSKAKRPDESYKTTKPTLSTIPAYAKRESSIAMVAVKVTDMLGEEVLVVKGV